MFTALSLFLVYQFKDAGIGLAQTAQDISVSIVNSSFAPLTPETTRRYKFAPLPMIMSPHT
jgi:hypothetical protein